jgi:hypothetical protein
MPVFLSYQRDAQGERRFSKKALGTMRGNVWMDPRSSQSWQQKKELSSSLSAYAVKSTHGACLILSAY